MEGAKRRQSAILSVNNFRSPFKVHRAVEQAAAWHPIANRIKAQQRHTRQPERSLHSPRRDRSSLAIAAHDGSPPRMAPGIRRVSNGRAPQRSPIVGELWSQRRNVSCTSSRRLVGHGCSRGLGSTRSSLLRPGMTLAPWASWAIC